MLVNTNSLVSTTEANQNFSKVASLVDENRSSIILSQSEEFAVDADVKSIGEKIIKRNLKAFSELAK
ncbi:MAG: type II toxin-antitoxin system Phd/YefM family antitoxin [Clostridia bacterium]